VSLPSISGKKLIKALAKTGFTVECRRESHVKLKKKDGEKVLIVIVPGHTVVAKGTLMSIIRQANITEEQLLKLL
jgi:predicted RNA binding protein YcfA (HicA-like mRNA interferase family)